MDVTAQALANIGAEDFEKLVPAYLRRSGRDPRLVGLTETGVNEQGEFVAFPVDGIYVHTQLPLGYAVTTTERDQLNRKWLGGGQTDYRPGDIEKAAAYFKKLGLLKEGVVPKLYLATNLRLAGANDVQLKTDAFAKGQGLGVEIDFVEASPLLDFLNITADGQYLRAKLLGIDAERLSLSLLRDIGAESIAYHRSSVSLGQAGQAPVIQRDIQPEVLEALKDPTVRFVALRGVSGTGKSILAGTVSSLINNGDGAAIWVNAETLEAFDSVGGMLDKLIHRYRPSLNARAAEDALDLAVQTPNGLVVLVDDINQLQSPNKALATVRSLAAGMVAKSVADVGIFPPVRFLVPLWPGEAANIEGQNSATAAHKQEHERFIDMQLFSDTEIAELAQTGDPAHSDEAERLFVTLGGDPFLCGLAAANLPLNYGVSRADAVKEIFQSAVSSAAIRSVQIGPAGATPGEYKAALGALIEHMLRVGEPTPLWSLARKQLGDRQADLLHALNRTNSLGWIETDTENERWQWKHERLRDGLIGNWLAGQVVPRQLTGSMVESDLSLLVEPGLAEAWAMALVFIAADAARRSTMKMLAEHLPLALAEALRQDLFRDDEKLQEVISTNLADILAGYPNAAEKFVTGQRGAIIYKLTQTRNPQVLDILRGVLGNLHIWEARLRNGDLSGGIDWIKRHNGRFLPGSRYVALESAMTDFKAATAGRRQEVVDVLSRVLHEPDSFYAAAQIAGYLAWPEMGQHIWEAWNALDIAPETKLPMLDAVVWSIARCGDEQMSPQLEQALVSVSSISAEKRAQGNSSDRMWQFLRPMKSAARWPVNGMAIETYLKVALEHPELEDTVFYFVSEIDDPDAMEHYARYLAKGKGHLMDGEPLDPFDDDNDNGHSETKSFLFDPAVSVSKETRDRLWQLIVSDDEKVARVAFRLWKRFHTPGDLDRLRTVSVDNVLFDEVLKVRLKLRDHSAAGHLIERMNTEDDWHWWSRYAPFIYGARGVAEAFTAKLQEIAAEESGEEESGIAFMPLRGVPVDHLRRLIEEQRALLLAWQGAWLPLWRSDIPEALDVVREALKRHVVEEGAKLGPYFLSGSSFPHYVSRRMLETVTPYLHAFSEDDREQLVELAIRNGHASWSRHNLPEEHAKEADRAKLKPEEANLALDTASEKIGEGISGMLRTQHMYDLVRPPHGWPDRAPTALEWTHTWLVGHTTELRRLTGDRLTVAAVILDSRGTGQEVSWWQTLTPEDELGREVHANTLFNVRRRRWRNTDADGD